MSFFEELKRRNVFKVGIAYLASAWLLLQISDVILSNFDAPGWIFQTILWLVIIGFPITLVFAWAFEMTPEGLKKDEDVDRSVPVSPSAERLLNAIVIASLVLAVGYFAYDEFVIDPMLDQPPAAVMQNSIAVLPFENLSSDPEQGFFSDGLSEDILNLLTKVPDLKVIGIETVTRLRDADIDVIRETIGVNAVLRGSVRRSGERLRITAQLIDARDGSQTWSDSYDRTMTDVFAVQDEVAAKIIDALQIYVGTNPSRGRPTDNAEAYVLFLKARNLLNTLSGGDALALLQQATALDTEFAEAWELMALSYWRRGGGAMDVFSAQELGNNAAARALDINADLPLARTLYEVSRGDRNSKRGALESWQRVRRTQPGSAEAIRPLIYELTLRGYVHEANRVALQYVELDPLSPVANYSLGETYYALGQIDDALPLLEFAAELGNDFATWFIPIVYLIEGNDERAIAHFEAESKLDGIVDTDWIRELITAGRDPVTGQETLDRRIPEILAAIPEEHRIEWRHTVYVWYLVLGFSDRFFDLIFEFEPTDQGWGDADVFVWEATNFRQTGFTAHPRYVEIAQALGITSVWDQRGPPDFCEKVSGDWICE